MVTNIRYAETVCFSFFDSSTRVMVSGVLAAVLTLVVSVASADNLVVNGGFEDPAGPEQYGPGWTAYRVDGNPLDDNTITGYAHSGSQAACFGEEECDGVITQTLSTVAGQQYLFSFWFASDGGTPNDFSAKFGDTTVFSVVNAPSQPYEYYSYQLTATSATTPISFAGMNVPGYLDLDDVSVTPVPEPSTLVLLAIGVVSLLAYAWRKRRRTA
jgi:hypothetical protein